jgi:hypothetical protein
MCVVDLVVAVGLLVFAYLFPVAGKQGHAAILILAFGLLAVYVCSCWTRKGKRLGLFWRKRIKDWRKLDTPHRASILRFLRHVIYYRGEALDDHKTVRIVFLDTADREGVQNRIARLFRKHGESEFTAVDRIAEWERCVRNSTYYLIVSKMPRNIGGWAQTDLAFTQTRLGATKRCILGLERFILISGIAESTAIHELTHVAQEVRDGFLSRENSGVSMWAGICGEFEAHMTAKKAAALILLRPIAMVFIFTLLRLR